MTLFSASIVENLCRLVRYAHQIAHFARIAMQSGDSVFSAQIKGHCGGNDKAEAKSGQSERKLFRIEQERIKITR
jgi:hypothetical protein